MSAGVLGSLWRSYGSSAFPGFGLTIFIEIIADKLQWFYYSLIIRAGDPKPLPGSQRHIQHRRRIKIIIILAYLLFAVYETDWNIRRAGDYYQDLGVTHDATDKEIKSRLRRLAAIHHPDKAAPGSQKEGYFMLLKQAEETLLDPVKRFAYDRFGPSINEPGPTWKNCATVSDYLKRGIQQVNTLQLLNAFGLLIYSALAYLRVMNAIGTYWRWLLWAASWIFEIYVVTRPYAPPVAASVINPLLTTFANHPPYLQFQLIELVRKLWLTFQFALGYLGPLLQSPEAARMQGNPDAVMKQQLDRLEATAIAADTEASRMKGMEMAPFASDESSMRNLRGVAKEWLVQNTIRSDPEVRDALRTAIQRPRAQEPTEAADT